MRQKLRFITSWRLFGSRQCPMDKLVQRNPLCNTTTSRTLLHAGDPLPPQQDASANAPS